MKYRSLLLVVGALTTSIILASCGGGGSTPVVAHSADAAAESLSRISSEEEDLAAWVRSALHAAEDERNPAELHLRLPPPVAEIHAVNSSGWSKGADLYAETTGLYRFRAYVKRKTPDFACDLFAFYRASPYGLPTFQEFEEYVYQQTVTRILPPPKWEEYRASVESLWSGIVEARNLPEAVVNAEMGAYCSFLRPSSQ
jgi:hypothetical protein